MQDVLRAVEEVLHGSTKFRSIYSRSWNLSIRCYFSSFCGVSTNKFMVLKISLVSWNVDLSDFKFHFKTISCMIEGVNNFK